LSDLPFDCRREKIAFVDAEERDDPENEAFNCDIVLMEDDFVVEACSAATVRALERSVCLRDVLAV
jgi:hypothetical protein